jgi:hypothetical protein
LDNLKKCLAAGFDHVVSVSNQASIVRNIRRAVESQLESGGEIGGAAFTRKDLERLRFFTLDEIESWLAELAEQDAATPRTASTAPPKSADDEAETKTIGGRRVMVKRSLATNQERQKIEEESLRMIAELLVNPKPTSSEE